MEIKLNMENLTEQERDTLLGLVEKANKQKFWKPKNGERYYSIDIDGEVDDDSVGWHSDETDQRRYAIGNCFRTREDAEFAVEKLKVTAELRRFAEEHNEEIDWKNTHQAKHYLVYYCSIDEVITDFWGNARYRSIVFSSREIALNAIAAIGADRLKKYYFEVED